MRQLPEIFIIILILCSCGQHREEKHLNLGNNVREQKDKLFGLFDTLEHKFNSLPVNFDSLYVSAKALNILADKYENQDEVRLAEVFKICALIYRLQEDENCNPNKSQLLCNKDSLIIIECYKKAMRIYKNNSDTTSSNFADALYQLADVYEQLEKPQLALPIRTNYLNTMILKEGLNSERTGSAYLDVSGTYEKLHDKKNASYYYSLALENRKRNNKLIH